MADRDIVAQSIAANIYMSHYSVERERQLGDYASRFYDDRRNIYSIAGYPKELSVDLYLGRYQRDCLARRIVKAAPNDTWRKPFKMLDGATIEDGVSDTEFVKAWEKLVQFDSLDGDLLDDSRRNLWYYFYEADKKCGIGQYAVMVLGFADNQPLDKPLRKNSGRALLYIDIHSEYQARILPSDLVKDPNNARFGLPEFYHIDYGVGIGQVKVHYSRAIHVAEGGVLYGESRLEAPYNRLIDIEKIAAGSGEASWQAIARKVIIKGREGYSLSEGTVTADKVEAMIHGFKNVLELEGADAEVVSGEVVDPTGAFDVQVNLLCAGTEIPKRKLFGAEAGELASGQEKEQWNDVISSRRIHFVEPVIIRPFVRRMIYAGLLPKPATGSYVTDWPSLDEPDNTTQAQTFETYARGVAQLTGEGIDRIVKPAEVVKHFIRGLPADAIPTEQEISQLEQQAMDRQQQQMEMIAARKEKMQPESKPEPAVNSYSRVEQQAVFEAAVKILAQE